MGSKLLDHGQSEIATSSSSDSCWTNARPKRLPFAQATIAARDKLPQSRVTKAPLTGAAPCARAPDAETSRI